MEFVKMHGLGNDYIFLQGHQPPPNLSQLACTLSHRHFGVGADGLIFIGASQKADCAMTMYNADGSQGEMCGNGIRCVGKYLYDHHLTQKTTITVETLGGIKTLHLTVTDGMVGDISVDMGVPQVLWGEDLPLLDGHHPVTAVDMGNPHAVLFCPNIQKAPLEPFAMALKNHPYFPNGVNVEVAEVVSPNHLAMRVWERGSGETMACGTGACAVLVAAVTQSLCQPKATITLPGGDLQVQWHPSHHITLTGTATTVFCGTWQGELAPLPHQEGS